MEPIDYQELQRSASDLTLVFETEPEQRREIAALFMSHIFRQILQLQPVAYVLSCSVSGPAIPRGVAEKDHPGWARTFVMVRTTSPEALERYVRKCTQVRFTLHREQDISSVSLRTRPLAPSP